MSDKHERLPEDAARLTLLVAPGGTWTVGGDPDPEADPRAESLPLGLKRLKERLAKGYPLREMKAELAAGFRQAIEQNDREGLDADLNESEAAGWAEWAVGLFEQALIAGSLAGIKAGSIWQQFRSLHAHLGEIEAKIDRRARWAGDPKEDPAAAWQRSPLRDFIGSPAYNGLSDADRSAIREAHGLLENR